MNEPHRFLDLTVLWLEECSSTQDEIRLRAEAGAPEGTVVVSHRQFAGRGRRGRAWFHADALGLACSILLRPALPAERLPLVTVALGIGAARAFREILGIPASLHWPNDLVAPGLRKFGGILAEARMPGDGPAQMLVGIGLNVGHASGDFPAELRDIATSLLMLRPADPPTREAALDALLAGFDRGYELVCTADDDALAAAWRAVSADLGQRARVTIGEQSHEGLVEGFHPNDGILLRQDDDTLLPVRAEQVARFRLVEE
jgi:BirA family biotin operon repressor/biotin-[acetyl-CoA-carboxylase] ligase